MAARRSRYAGPAGRYDNLLILVELKGGNDGLNTVVPYADSEYYSLRPRIAIARDQVLQLDGRAGLHPSLQPLMALWQNRELAVVQGVGYPSANLSHFRSIEIWDTASKSTEYLSDGWLTRAFADAPVPKSFAADGIIVGSNELGPLAGGGTRALALTNTEQFLRQARLAGSEGASRNPALNHLLKVEQDVAQAAVNLNSNYALSDRVSAAPARQRIQDRGAGDREQGRGGRGQGHAQWIRHAQRPAGHAAAAAQGTGGRADGHARRHAGNRALGRDADDDLLRIRPAAEGKPERRHRPRHGQRAFRARRPRQGRALRPAAGR